MLDVLADWSGCSAVAGLVVWRRCYARGVGSWWKEDQRGGRADEGRHVYGIVQVFFAGAVAGRLDFEIGTWLHYRLLSEKISYLALLFG